MIQQSRAMKCHLKVVRETLEGNVGLQLSLKGFKGPMRTLDS
jgi:hypothetical protein